MQRAFSLFSYYKVNLDPRPDCYIEKSINEMTALIKLYSSELILLSG
jgi:hypothetical protein